MVGAMNQQERRAALMALQARWGVQQGQVWEIAGSRALTSHWAICADARGPAQQQVTSVLGWPWPIVGIFTSPPYLGQRAYEGGDRLGQRAWQNLTQDVLHSTLRHTMMEAQVIVNLGPVHEGGRLVRYWEPWIQYMEATLGWPLLATNIWDKLYPVPGDHYGRFGTQHEYLFHFAKQGIGPDKVIPASNAGKPGKSSKKHGQGQTYGHGDWTAATDIVADFKIPGSVVRIPVPGGFREKDPGASVAQLHPARFPIELPAFHIRAYKRLLPHGFWADPFAGSFTTLLAGDREGVPTLMIESEPTYFALALERCLLEGLAPRRVQPPESVIRTGLPNVRDLFR